ncbi:UNVERIFIED_CONTAM: hypothetical protein K2H54_002979 [Gekko kuhli]
MRLLALLLLVRLAAAGPHAPRHHGHDHDHEHHDAAGEEEEAARLALARLLASGEGAVPRGAVEALLNIAAARVQCPAGPCGKEGVLRIAALLSLASPFSGLA